MNEYVAPIVTVDGVVFQIIDNQLCVLLVRRSAEPFKNQLALPGGYNSAGETTTECLERILANKAGVKKKQLKLVEQLFTFDNVARDPRGHAVSVTYMGLGKDILPIVSKTTQTPEFYPVNHLPELSYDHGDIIKYARERLVSKISYTNAVYALLDEYFTLTQLQSAYEAIINRELDKRNFRKKFLSLDLVRQTEEYQKDGAHRPARLYTFKKQELDILSRNFD
jgi:8-oxo-dGTP diphosphatase